MVSGRGNADVELRTEDGLRGDVTTRAVVVNSVPRIAEADPGLATMIDLATPRYDAG